MDKKETLIDGLKGFKKNLSRDMEIERIIFFGSRAHGHPSKDSDIDLLIVSEKFSDQKFYKRPVKLYDYWNLDYPVDFLCYTPEEFNRLSKQVTIVREALKTGIVI